MNEPQLIEQCLQGDKKAWGIFIERYSRLAYWSIKKRLNISNFYCNDADIQDIFQDVFLAVFKKETLGRLKDVRSVSGWLAMVASNKAIDFMRQKARLEQRAILDMPLLKGEEVSGSPFPDDTDTILKTVIDNLSERERVVISLNIIEERTHKEISEITGMPVNTVSTIVARTKAKIKKELEEKGMKEN